MVAIDAQRTPDGADPAAPGSNTGSGVFIRSDGMILTSQHVIDGALAVYATLHDGRRVRARLVAADIRADLAVVSINASAPAVASLGDARTLHRGHIVLAFGNPLGLASDGQASVSQGLISAIGRPLPGALGLEQDRYYGDMIQTSAKINPGDSGGPLVDLDGRVVGVITALSASRAGGEGVGFAVPIDARTSRVIDKLLRGQTVEYGYLGVEVTDLRDRGVLIASMLPDGPAQHAGLRIGDVIVAVDNAEVHSADQFVRLIGAAEPHKTVEIDFLREGTRGSTTAPLDRRGPRSDRLVESANILFRGATLGRVPARMREAANLPEHALLVVMVDGGSPAERAGLTPGDIVVRVEGKAVSADAAMIFQAVADDCLLGLASGGSLLVKAK